jgi:hypothetical protein
MFERSKYNHLLPTITYISLPLEYVTVQPLSFVTITAVYVPVIKLNAQHNRISLSSMIISTQSKLIAKQQHQQAPRT